MAEEALKSPLPAHQELFCDTLVPKAHVAIFHFPVFQQVGPQHVPAVPEEASRASAACSDPELRSLQPDPRLEHLLRHASAEEFERLNEEARRTNRHPELLALYPAVDEVSRSPGSLSQLALPEHPRLKPHHSR